MFLCKEEMGERESVFITPQNLNCNGCDGVPHHVVRHDSVFRHHLCALGTLFGHRVKKVVPDALVAKAAAAISQEHSVLHLFRAQGTLCPLRQHLLYRGFSLLLVLHARHLPVAADFLQSVVIWRSWTALDARVLAVEARSVDTFAFGTAKELLNLFFGRIVARFGRGANDETRRLGRRHESRLVASPLRFGWPNNRQDVDQGIGVYSGTSTTGVYAATLTSGVGNTDLRWFRCVVGRRHWDVNDGGCRDLNDVRVVLL